MRFRRAYPGTDPLDLTWAVFVYHVDRIDSVRHLVDYPITREMYTGAYNEAVGDEGAREREIRELFDWIFPPVKEDDFLSADPEL